MIANNDLSWFPSILLLCGAAVLSAVSFRIFASSTSRTHTWNRFDRYAFPDDIPEGSFPASDPPSTLP